MKIKFIFQIYQCKIILNFKIKIKYIYTKLDIFIINKKKEFMKHLTLEQRIAKNLAAIGVKNLSVTDKANLNERVRQYLTEAETPVNLTANFTFTFPSGKYLAGDVPDASIQQLFTDMENIISNIKTPVLLKLKTVIDLNAQASTVPINPQGALPKAGIKTNEQLAQKRMETLEFIIREIIKSRIPSITDAQIDQLITFNRQTSVGKTTSITAKINQTGEPLKKPFNCNTVNSEFEGVEASVANSYVGYSFAHTVSVAAGTKVTITFDPLDVPDCFWVKYGDKESLSGFLGRNALNYKSDLARLQSSLINAKIAEYGGTSKISTKIQPGVQQGGTGKWEFEFDKVIEEDEIRVLVFSPLKGTIFKISLKCDDTNAKPLPLPTQTSLGEKQALAIGSEVTMSSMEFSAAQLMDKYIKAGYVQEIWNKDKQLWQYKLIKEMGQGEQYAPLIAENIGKFLKIIGRGGEANKDFLPQTGAPAIDKNNKQ